MSEQVGLAVEDESGAQSVNVKLSHLEQAIFLERETVGLYPGIGGIERRFVLFEPALTSGFLHRFFETPI